MKRFNTVDAYIAGHPDWAKELVRIREILNSTELEETVKWGAPGYTCDGKNVIGVGAFKHHISLWFHQGALLSDPEGVLANAQEGKTIAMRQWRIESAKDIKARAIKAYVKEAIELQRAGKTLGPRRDKPIIVPPELEAAFKKSQQLRTAFESLTPGKQRQYTEHVSEAKREATKLSRVEKIKPMILDGVGLHDKYKDC
ncbi:MAG: DUF1801 domain-containing protein [Planctomycetota bacterium]